MRSERNSKHERGGICHRIETYAVSWSVGSSLSERKIEHSDSDHVIRAKPVPAIGCGSLDDQDETVLPIFTEPSESISICAGEDLTRRLTSRMSEGRQRMTSRVTTIVSGNQADSPGSGAR